MQVLLGTTLSPVLPLLLPCVLLILICKLWTVYNVRSKDPNCKAPLPEGSMGIPFFGETLQLLLFGAEFYQKKYAKYGRVFKTHLLGQPSVRVIGAANVRRVLLGEGDIVQVHYPRTVQSVLGSKSILVATGKEHDRLRKLVSKAFNIHALSEYVPYMQQFMTEAVKSWCDKGQVCAESESKVLIFRVAGKLLCNFDYDEEESRHLSQVFATMVDNMLSLPINIPGSQFNKAIRARNIIRSRVEASLKKKKESENDLPFTDALRIVSEGGHFNTEQLKELALELLFAGHSTTSSTAVMMIHYLAQRPDIVKRVRNELDEFDLLDEEEPLKFEDISKLKYTSSVIKEVFRISPPIGAGFRKVIKTFQLEGKQIPAGWTLLFSIRETHALADNFAEVEKFDPDRFMPERNEEKKGDRFNFIPFGGGSRGCVGKQMAQLMLKILLITLSRNCRWELVNQETPRIELMPCPHPIGGLPVRISRLDCNANRIDFKKVNEAGDVAC